MAKYKIFSRAHLMNFVFILLGIVALLSFSEMDRFWRQNAVNQLDISFANAENAMVDEAFIQSLLEDEFEVRIGQTSRSDIQEDTIENRLVASPWIDSAQVYLNNEGILKIDLKVKDALFRIINNNGVQYYVDKNGSSAPVSNIFIDKVIVCSGNVPDSHLWPEFSLKDILGEYAEAIGEDPFLSALVEQIYVDADYQLKLITSIKGHHVNIGRPNAVKKEMNDLSAFYQSKFSVLDWSRVEEVDTRFKGQVICRLKED